MAKALTARDTLIEGLQGLFPNTSFSPLGGDKIVFKIVPIGDVFIAVSRTGRTVVVTSDSVEEARDGHVLTLSPITAQEVLVKIKTYVCKWLRTDAFVHDLNPNNDQRARWSEILRVMSLNPNWRQIAVEIVAEKQAEVNQRLAQHLENTARITRKLEEEIRSLAAYEDKLSGNPPFNIRCAMATHCDSFEVFTVEGGFFHPWGSEQRTNLPEPTRPEECPELGPWKHFKGQTYRVLGTAQDADTMEHYVVYQADAPEGTVWLRPLSQWEEIIDRSDYHGPRFFKAQ